MGLSQSWKLLPTSCVWLGWGQFWSMRRFLLTRLELEKKHFSRWTLLCLHSVSGSVAAIVGPGGQTSLTN